MSRAWWTAIAWAEVLARMVVPLVVRVLEAVMLMRVATLHLVVRLMVWCVTYIATVICLRLWHYDIDIDSLRTTHIAC